MQFEASFGIASRGVELDPFEYISGEGELAWRRCPEEILLPPKFDLESSIRVSIETSVCIGQIETDQPIVVDYSVPTPRVLALVGPPYRWRVLAQSVDEFFDALGM